MWLRGPDPADLLGRRTADGRLWLAGRAIGGDDVGRVRPRLFMAFVMKASDGRYVGRPVHSVDLPLADEMVGSVRRWSMPFTLAP